MDINWYSLQPDQQQAILDGPGLAPPPGITPNFENPPNQNLMVLAVLSVALSVATTSVLIRIWAKVVCVGRTRLEDYIGLVAFGFYVAHAWSIFAVTKSPGMFVHQWDVQFRDVAQWTQTLSLLRTFYFLTLGCAKIAILLEWVHLFVPGHTRNLFFWLCHATIATTIAIYIAAIPLTFLVCIPQEAAWNPFIPGKCISRWAADISVFSFHLVTDVITFLLPQKVIWSLNMPKRQRAGVSVVFSFGVLTCICALARVYTLTKTDYAGDAIYQVSTIILWGVGETTALILVFCVPAAPRGFLGNRGLAVILSRPFQSWIRTTSASTGSTGSHIPEKIGSSKKPKQMKGFYSQLEEIDSVRLQDLSTADPREPTVDQSRTVGITKTTELVVQGETAPGVKGGWLQQQHPWLAE
ncbi:hypothetical protein EV127DRAFT_368553 [Xylaria flabelliformis]|nr:hypothetical protein EV127DRAFT_368553 [Xylaria flabelliformis]